MKKNFLNDYNFDRDVKYTSQHELCNREYDRIAEKYKKWECKKFYCQNHDLSIPLYVPISTECNEVEIIDFIGDVILNNDYQPETPIIIEGKVNVNLNGKKIIAPLFIESNGEVTSGSTDSYGFWVKNGELTIDGEGEIIAQEATYSMAVWANGGKVIIKNGKFYNNGNNSDLIYASNGSTVEIYGGEFHANKNEGASGTKNLYPALNIKDKDRENTSILVYGGRFFGFDPSNNLSEGSNTNFVAEGYKSIEVEPNVWEVVKE